MKVIGVTGDYKKTYICEVTHDEIERFLNLYYNKLERLTPGQEVDLGKGYNFAYEIQEAFKKTQEFLQAHEKVTHAILNGLRFLAVETEKPAVKKGGKSDGN